MGAAKTPKIYSAARHENGREVRAYRSNVRRVEWIGAGEIPELSRRFRPVALGAGSDSTLFRSSARGSLLALLVIAAAATWFVTGRTPNTERSAIQSLDAAMLHVLPLPDAAPRSRSRITHVVKTGDTLETVLVRYGSKDRETQTRVRVAVEKAGSSVSKPLPARSKLSLIYNREGGLSEVAFRQADGLHLQLSRKDDRFVTRALEQAVERGDRVIAGTVRSSFAADAMKLGLNYDTIDDLVDLFGDRFEFRRDFQPGDRFTIILSAPSDVSGGGSSQSVLAAAFDVGGKQFAAIRYVGHDGRVRYFDETGQPLGNTFLRYPVKFSRVSSMFSDARLHPILKRSRPHNGVDFAAPTGTPVRAVAGGQIVLAGYRGPSGNMVRIRHSDRWTTEYLHLSKIFAGGAGRTVQKGDVIGLVGCTGLCSGPHLHFGLFEQGKYIDPLSAKVPAADLLGPGQLIAPVFLERVMLTLNYYQRAATQTLLAQR